MNEEQRLVQKRLRVLEHAQKTGNVRKTCRYFGIGRSSFYRWKSAFDREGEAGLVNKPRVARNHPNQLSREVVDRVLLQIPQLWNLCARNKVEPMCREAHLAHRHKPQ